jgi:phosphoribosylaminoimidazole-succinocarboxamide synthase
MLPDRDGGQERSAPGNYAGPMRPALSDYRHLASGKVRELYRIDDEHLLFVATDRISAYDHILSSQIPDKGRILTAMSVFFFDLLDAPNHLAGPPDDARIPAEVLGRALVVRQLEMLPVECVARGYLTGSGLIDYRKTGALCGITLPPDLTEASRFAEPLYTPASKAELGAHDENIDYAATVGLVGEKRAEQLRERTLQIYTQGAEHALTKGIIIADTKFEFGVDQSGELVLADEVFTPDSSRYWYADAYREGEVQPSYDKQFVRNWLTGPESGWDRAGEQPPPPLPPEIVDATRSRYIEAYERISGLSFAAWIGASA